MRRAATSATKGISGVRRFLEGVWRHVRELDPQAKASDALLRATHRAIGKVQEDIEGLRYNTAIAALMSLANDIRRLGPPDRWVLESWLIMIAPFCPHVTEELWEALGHTTSIFDARWPRYDEAMTVEESLVLPVQVNGKVRGRITVANDTPEEQIIAAALAEASVQAHISGKEIRKQVVVPGRLVSLVV